MKHVGRSGDFDLAFDFISFISSNFHAYMKVHVNTVNFRVTSTVTVTTADS